jgi:NAD(P)-dependent dehydrogenase (short-subunit alcohol dehydrogenase family)
MTAIPPVVLITGASSGIGLEVATRLLAGPATVYVAALEADSMRALVEAGAHAIALDVRDDVAVKAVVARILDEQGRIDVLVNNAGYGQFGFIECVPLEDIQRQFDVNVYGYARFIQAVLPHMRRQRSGRVINMSSVCGHITMPGLGWYAASKHAVRAMTESLRLEVESFGIHVVSIEPGAIATGFQALALTALEASACPDDYTPLARQAAAFHGRIGLNASSTASTVAAVLRAIADPSPRAVYRTTLDARVAPPVLAALGARRFGNLILRRFRRAGRA